MAGFKMHIGTSTVLGVAYGATAGVAFGVSPPTCILAGGLCSISGMLPDLDSGPGVPLRESVAFAAAVVPMLMIRRFEHFHLSPEAMVLVGAAIYMMIRFGLAKVLRRCTVHRGMFHSLPAALIAAELAFLLCAHEEVPAPPVAVSIHHTSDDQIDASEEHIGEIIDDSFNHGLWVRYFNAGAVLLGFMSHLVLDEIYSIEFRKVHIKKSFGTAMKFWGDSLWPNLVTYAQVILLTLLVLRDPVWMRKDTPNNLNLRQMTDQMIDKVWR